MACETLEEKAAKGIVGILHEYLPPPQAEQVMARIHAKMAVESIEESKSMKLVFNRAHRALSAEARVYHQQFLSLNPKLFKEDETCGF